MSKHGTMRGTTWVKNEDTKNMLRMGGGSWTINLDEIPSGALDIEYWTERTVYTISVKDAHSYGFIRILGGETKLVVPLGKWTKREEVIDV